MKDNIFDGTSIFPSNKIMSILPKAAVATERLLGLVCPVFKLLDLYLCLLYPQGCHNSVKWEVVKYLLNVLSLCISGDLKLLPG